MTFSSALFCLLLFSFSVLKQERPLKYETTRPVSGTKARRVQSAKERLQSDASQYGSNGISK